MCVCDSYSQTTILFRFPLKTFSQKFLFKPKIKINCKFCEGYVSSIGSKEKCTDLHYFLRDYFELPVEFNSYFYFQRLALI